VSAAHSRGPAGPVVHRSHSSRLAEREGLGSFGDDCGLSQSSGRPIMGESVTRSWSVEWSQETQSVSEVWPPTARRLGRTRQGVSESARLSPGSDNEGGGRGQSSVRSMEKEKSGLQLLECSYSSARPDNVKRPAVVNGLGECGRRVSRV
jgi:hypothetical protein